MSVPEGEQGKGLLGKEYLLVGIRTGNDTLERTAWYWRGRRAEMEGAGLELEEMRRLA